MVYPVRGETLLDDDYLDITERVFGEWLRPPAGLRLVLMMGSCIGYPDIEIVSGRVNTIYHRAKEEAIYLLDRVKYSNSF